MSQQGRYIYGIIEEPGEKRFGFDGVSGDGVCTVNYKDLAAVISYVPVESYDRFSEQLEMMSVKHELVLENILKNYTVIPMGFGVIAKSEEDVTKLLETAYPDFKDTLRAIDNKVELSVQVTSNEAKLLYEVAVKNETLKKLRQELISAGAGDATKIKIEMGKAISLALDELKDEYVRDVLVSLNNVAVDSCSGKLTDAQIILNESFLVRRDREVEFDGEVNRLAGKYEDNLKFKYIGPMPPYSFVRLAVSVMNFDTVDRARQLLGLEEQVSLAEIKNAYRKLARQYHPDKNSGDQAKAEIFKDVTRNFEVLERCIQSLKPAENGKYLLRPEQIEGAILVSRRG